MVLLDADYLALEVDIVGPALVELDIAQPPDGLKRGAELEGADCGRGEKGGEDEVGTRRDDYSLIFGGVEGPCEGITSPACGWLSA